MQKMLTIKNEEVYIDLASIKVIKSDIQILNEHSSRMPTERIPMSVVGLGGDCRYYIKEPSFTELLSKIDFAQRNR